VALKGLDLDLWFSWLPYRDGHSQPGWKLHDIRLPELDSDLTWYDSISEATTRVNGLNGNPVKVS
jgi:hypothetical protein